MTGIGIGRPRDRASSAVARYRSNVARASPLCAVKSASCASDTSSCVLKPREKRSDARRNASCASLDVSRRPPNTACARRSSARARATSTATCSWCQIRLKSLV